MKGALQVVSPRPPRSDGQGDQRRASVIVEALAPEWDVSVISWLPDVDANLVRRWTDTPLALVRAAALATRMPLQVAFVQARLPKEVRAAIAAPGPDRMLFVTSRAVPPGAADGFVIDFVDDLGGAALRRARSSSGLRAAFWRWEGRRMRALDRRTAARAGVAIACNAADASAIGPGVQVVPLAVACRPTPETGDTVVFVGNLFYAPNHEAAMWICDELVPSLADLGVGAGRIVIAGRRPRPALRRRAELAGVAFRPDVDDLSDVLSAAAVVIAPMELGSGTQNKILDAVGAGRACVITPHANASLDLVDGRSALVCERGPGEFAKAIVTLLDDPERRSDMVAEARRHLAGYLPDAVHEAWRAALR